MSLNAELKENIDRYKQMEELLNIIIEAKERVSSIVAGLKTLSKKSKIKKTKNSREAIRTMEDFINCSITNPAIFDKYIKVLTLLERYATKDDNKVQTGSGT